MKLTKYSQLKHGMRVRGVFTGKVFADAKLSIDSNGYVYVCQNVFDGIDTLEKLGYRYSLLFCAKNKNAEDWTVNQIFTVEDDELIVKEGDLLIDTDGCYRRVLGVCGCVAMLSVHDNYKNSCRLRNYNCCLSFVDLTEQDYTIVDEEEPETTEMDGKKYIKKENDDGTITFIPA